jgi:glucosamine-6-phosphate deaminase
MSEIKSRTELKRFEKITTRVFDDAAEGSLYVAGQIARLIRERSSTGRFTVLGLATGSTPVRVYDELVRIHREDGLSFKNVITFNLDEYYPMQPEALQSYVRFMHEYFFNQIDINPDNIHIPDGTTDRDGIVDYCRQYEQQIEKAGGIDIQLLGIGRTGHIGFNEPGSGKKSRTRLITLDRITRADAASDFFGEENVPRRALTMGVGSILKSRTIYLMAWGEKKSGIIRQTVEGPVSDTVPATYLQDHPDAEIILDNASSAELTRFKTPWLVGQCDWSDKMIRKAVVWLSQEVQKPVLKLTDMDYNENGMSDLITDYGPAYNINIKVFNELQHTITGWPGGKPDSDDTNRPERKKPYPKRALIFSPHPDDDVISMGGTLIRLVDQKHEVHVAYQTSGNIAVFDDQAIRFADFIIDYQHKFGLKGSNITKLFNIMSEFLNNKTPGQADSDEIKTIKGLIRRGEAKAACRYCGIPIERAHFLNMPFYETGVIRKKPLSEDDIQIIVDLITEIKPHQIYAAGDLSDPHGTHRVCLKAIMEAIRRLKDEDWMKDCFVWLYRGAWQEWDIDQIEMAVPLSPDELARKRRAIFKHESQKDRPLFPGPDPREFWQRADDRTRTTARLYDQLGLAEYEAIEAFVRYLF